MKRFMSLLVFCLVALAFTLLAGCERDYGGTPPASAANPPPAATTNPPSGAQTSPASGPHLTPTAKAVKQAFLELNAKHWDNARELAEEVIKHHGEAEMKQDSLADMVRADPHKLPPTGKVDKATFDKVMANGGILNDVGAAYVILGLCLKEGGPQEKEQAREVLTKGSKLTMARCWDPNSDDPDAGYNPDGWLWDTSKKCLAELRP